MVTIIIDMPEAAVQEKAMEIRWGSLQGAVKGCGGRGYDVVWMKVIAVNVVVVWRGSMNCRGGVGSTVLVFSL